MSQLDPELKRLIRWSRTANEELPKVAPFGVAARVSSCWCETVEQAEPAWWSRLQVAAAGVSVAILLAGGTIWARRLNAPSIAHDFASAYQLIAQNVAP